MAQPSAYNNLELDYQLTDGETVHEMMAHKAGLTYKLVCGSRREFYISFQIF